MNLIRRSLVSCALFLLAAGAEAQGFPAQPVRVIVAFPAGGAIDVVARLISERLSAVWKQPVIVDNRSGANGAVGTRLASKASPDGYTLTLSNSSVLAINPALESSLGYDPVKDFSHIGLVGVTPNILYASQALPVRSVQDFIRFATAEPGKFTIGSGTSSAQVAADLFQSMGKIKLTHVPYKGNPEALIDLITGRIDVMFVVPAAVSPGIAKRIRPLAITTSSRQEAYPQLPTVSESGLSGYEAVSWISLSAPAGLPEQIRNKLHADLNQVLSAPDVQKRLIELGITPRSSPKPSEFTDFVIAETVKWQGVVNSSSSKK